jgi:hypothetical protein
MDNKEEIVKSLMENLEKMENKDFSIYFFVIDTQGNAVGSVAYIYEQVKVLTELGYKASILHEKNDYTTNQISFIKTWLGEEYAELPHVSIENQNIKVSVTDFIIIPELFANVMEQTVNIPAKRIVLCQSYDYITETLQPGKSWKDYGINDCITTTDSQKEYIESLFNGLIKVSVVPVSVDDTFSDSSKPKKPIVAISTRDQRDTVKIFKTFYLKYPHLKWVTFRDMRGMSKSVFAKALAESCVSVWVDDIAGFGGFALESMKCSTPVIGKIPNLLNGWMDEKNGIWVDSINAIPDVLSKYLQAWLEDNYSTELLESMKETVGNYTPELQKEKIKEVYGEIFNSRIEEFKTTLSKYKVDNVEEKIN